MAQTPAPARYFNPRFSADGTTIIFESTRDGKYTVYAINADGTGLRRITDARQNDAQPQWSADGTMITFTSDVTPNLNKVFVSAADGSNRKQISTGPKNDAAPSFSPDGQYVAWAATTEAPENWRDIGVAPVSGAGGQRLITTGPGNDHSPVWISNTRLVFVREFPPKTDWTAMTPDEHLKRRASSEIMAVDITGQTVTNLTNNTIEDGSPSWAPAVSRLFFRSFRESSPALFSMKPDGTDVQRAAAAPEAAAISPDGKFVTFSKVVNNRSGIFVRELATGTERELVGGEK